MSPEQAHALGPSGFAITVVFLLLFLFGMLLGVRIGDGLSHKCVTKKQYFLYNLGIFGVGVLLSFMTAISTFQIFIGLDIGLIGGALAGLKMGFAESAGPWKFFDKFFGVNKKHRKAAENSSKKEEARRRRQENQDEPELMSVDSRATSGYSHKEDSRK